VRLCDKHAHKTLTRGVCVRARRRFRALVAAHAWRAAAERHFGGVAARLVAAAATAPGGSGSGAGASALPMMLSSAPAPHEWRSLYKLLTFVPWGTAADGVDDLVAPLRRRGARSFGFGLRLRLRSRRR
jgi:hypothetical protein